MGFFKILFFWVANTAAYAKDGLGFHKDYFLNNGGFLYGFLMAVIIGLVISAVFYLGLCSNFSLAKTRNWWICLVITGIVTFFGADLVLIGGNGSKAPTTFYKSNEEFVKEHRKSPNVKEYTAKKVKIEQSLKKWGDVRFPFDTMCSLYGMVFFVGGAFLFKGFSRHGSQIPW